MSLPPNFNHLEPHLGKRPTLLLMRHMDRYAITKEMDQKEIMDVELTDVGRSKADFLGRYLKETHNLSFDGPLLSSWSKRCKETAALVAKGAKDFGREIQEIMNEDITVVPELSCYGFFSEEEAERFRKCFYNGRKIFTGDFEMDRTRDDIAKMLLKALLCKMDAVDFHLRPNNAFGIAATHDLPLAFLTFELLGFAVDADEWPQIGEVMLVQKIDHNTAVLFFRGKSLHFPI